MISMLLQLESVIEMILTCMLDVRGSRLTLRAIGLHMSTLNVSPSNSVNDLGFA